MTHPDDNTFPTTADLGDGTVVTNESGLTKLEYFAGLAMQGLMACDFRGKPHDFAKMSVEVAKELINELNK